MRVALLLRTFVLFCVRAMLRCCGVLSCFGCFVTDIHGIGPTCLLLLFCEYLCPGVFRERRGTEGEGDVATGGAATRWVGR